MVILNSIYSETGLFDRVEFRLGINVILGKYADAERSVNGIGKSTLVRLIDYAFLSSPRGSLNLSRAPLKGHTVSLEFTDGNERYTITRPFEDEKIAYFGLQENLREYPVEDLKRIIGDKLFLNAYFQGAYYDNKWYRELMRFFIKDDIGRHKQDDPLNFLNYNARKTRLFAYNFYLLGLPNANIDEYDLVQVDIRNKQTSRRELINQIEDETQKPISELRTQIAQVNQRISRLETSLREFKFLETYQDVQTELENVSLQISEKLSASLS